MWPFKKKRQNMTKSEYEDVLEKLGETPNSIQLKSFIFSDPVRSAQSATTFGWVFPNWVNPAPNPERVSFISIFSIVLLVQIYLNAL